MVVLFDALVLYLLGSRWHLIKSTSPIMTRAGIEWFTLLINEDLYNATVTKPIQYLRVTYYEKET